MPEAGRDTTRELAALRARVARLEARLERLEGSEPVGEVEEVEEVEPEPVWEPEPVEAAEVVPPPARIDYAPPPPPTPPAVAEGTLEQAIGLRWTGWLGALIVVIGAGLAVKYAFDAGWLGAAPPELRLAGMALGAFALIAAGEWAFRRVGPAAAVGLYAAGVGTLFLVDYAGWAVLEVYGQNVAFALMAVTTLIGCGVAARSRLVSVAVVSLLGGNLAPLVVGGRADSILPLASFALMLQVVAVLLAWWGATDRWRALRWLSLATTAGWAALLLDTPSPAVLPSAFTLVYAAVFLAELVVSTLRPRRLQEAEVEAREGEGAAFAVIVVALLSAATLYALRDLSPFVRAAVLAIYAGAFAGGAVSLHRVARGRRLALTFGSLAAALAVIAVPVATDGPTVVLAWAAMSLAFVVSGARLDSPLLRVAAVATWVAAILYTTSEWPAEPTTAGLGFSLAGTVVSQGVVLAVLTGATGLAVARMLGAGTAARIVAIAASAVWGVGCVLGLPPVTGTFALVVLAWVLIGLDCISAGLLLAELAAAVLGVAMVKWAAVDLLARRLDAGWTAGQLAALPVLNPTMLLGSLIAGSAVAVWWLRLRKHYAEALRGREVLAAGLATAAVLIGFGLTMEIDRLIAAAEAGGWTASIRPRHLRLLGFTGLWTLCLVALGGGLLRVAGDPATALRWVAWPAALLALIAAKWVVFDTTPWHLDGRGGAGGTIGLNLEFAVGLTLAAALGGAWLFGRFSPVESASKAYRVAGFAALAAVLWLGVLEIDRGLRATPTLAGAGVTFQAALTGWWSALALSLVVAGLLLRVRGMRYFGLSLFAATLLKLFAIDLQFLDRGPRTVAFMAVGLLLLGTSVLYGRYGARLLASDADLPQTPRPDDPGSTHQRS